MNKLLLLFLAVFAGLIGFSALHRAVEQTRTVADLTAEESNTGKNWLTETQAMVAALRNEVLEKKNRLRNAARYPEISPELLRLLEGDDSKGHPAAWAELRQQLGIGWDSSPEYVLVKKQALKGLNYDRLVSAARVTDTASRLLAITPGEQAGLHSVLQHAREGWQTLAVVRNEAGGDIVAQYTLPPRDPVVQQSLSNDFTTGIAAAVGPERADLLLPQAWNDFRSGLGPDQGETMTIRRAQVAGGPDLICEMKQGGNVVWKEPVRYAHYPSSWFLTAFPGGWKTLAQREGFELPPNFQKNDVNGN